MSVPRFPLPTGGDDEYGETPQTRRSDSGLRAVVEQLRAQVETLSTRVQSAEGRAEDLSRVVEQQAQRLADAGERADEAEQLRARLDESDARAGRLENDVQSLQQQRDAGPDPAETQRGVDRLAQQVAGVQSQAQDLASVVESQAGALAEATARTGDAESLRTRLSANEAQTGQLQAALDALTAQHGDGPGTADLAAQLDALTARTDGLSGQNDRLQGIVDTQATRLADVATRAGDAETLRAQVSGLAELLARQGAAQSTERARAEEQAQRQMAALTSRVQSAETAAQQAADVQGIVEQLAGRVSELASAVDPARSLVVDAQLEKLAGLAYALHDAFSADPTLATALTRKGMQIPDGAITDVAASKLTGDIAAARLTTNLTSAWNTNTGYDIAKLTVGAVSNSQMGANAVDTTQIVNSAVTDAKISAVAASKLTGDLALGAGQKFATYGATAPVQQTSGANITNSVTAGGVNGTIADISTVSYAADGTDIRNALYQLARGLKIAHDAMRVYGLLS